MSFYDDFDYDDNSSINEEDIGNFISDINYQDDASLDDFDMSMDDDSYLKGIDFIDAYTPDKDSVSDDDTLLDEDFVATFSA